MPRVKKVHINMVFEGQQFVELEELRHKLGLMSYKETVRQAVKRSAEAIK